MPKYAKFKAKKELAPKMGMVTQTQVQAALNDEADTVTKTKALVAKKLPGKRKKGKKAKRAKKLNA